MAASGGTRLCKRSSWPISNQTAMRQLQTASPCAGGRRTCRSGGSRDEQRARKDARSQAAVSAAVTVDWERCGCLAIA